MPDAPPHIDYLNPPIVEALCQISFVPSPLWSVASPGELFTALKQDYPVTPKVQQQVQATIGTPAGGPPMPEGMSAFSFNTGSQRVVFSNPPGTKLVIAGPDSLSVNSLTPYEGWESVRSRFVQALNIYFSAVGPVAVGQVTIKYINRIVLAAGSDLSDYFEIPLWNIGSNGSTTSSVMTRVESKTPEDLDVVSLFATLEPDVEGTMPMLLDLEVRRALHSEPGSFTTNDLVEFAEELHAAENAAFERSIKDDCRGLFG